MKRIFIMACMLIITVSLAFTEQNITIGSINLAELGSSRPNKDHRAIADLIDDFDLIAIEEVQDKGGAEHIKAIVDSMNVSAPIPFSYFIIPTAGRGYPGNEGYALIYRSPITPDQSHSPAYGLKSTTVAYGRIPGYAYFKAGNFDFIIAVVHLHWSNLDTRKLETADLLTWMKEYADKPGSEERDLIIIGDTNRFGNYSNTAINNRQTDFHFLLDDPELGVKYRLPFCEYLPTMDAKEAPTDAGSTTVSDNNNMVYSQMFISSGAFNEFGPLKGTLGDNIGIIDFDNKPPYLTMTTDAIKDVISEHRPIYAKFQTDLPDDDGYLIEPPSNLTVSDVPGDQGHSLKLSWTPSPSEQTGNVSWYRIFRSRSNILTYPIALSQITTLDSLIIAEQFYTILIDSVAVGENTFVDPFLPLNGVSYYYWAQAVGSSGESSKIAIRTPLSVKEITPQSLYLGNAYPNPFNPSTTIPFNLSESGKVSLVIYSLSGQKIKDLFNGHLPSGQNSIVWDGKDAKGIPVSSGIYIAQLIQGMQFRSSKLVLMK